MYATGGWWLKWQTFIFECENLAEKRKKEKPGNSGFLY